LKAVVMKHLIPRLVALAFIGLPYVATAQVDCSAEVSEIERRIATGNYPDQNVQMARQLQGSLGQMCAFMDEGTKAAMMEGLEELLPVKSEEQREAERRIKSAEAKAARDARKREEQDANKNKPPASAVLLAASTAKLVADHLFDRGDMMYHTWTWDWDTYKGNLRILYSSFPDRTQFGLPDWKFHVYVAEMTPSGKTTHHLITSKHASDHFGLALRRGYDEVLFHRHVDGPEQDGPAALERWSIAEPRMLSSVDITNLDSAIDSESWQPPMFRMATSDGNILYETLRSGKDPDKRMHLGWLKLSPDGHNLGSGTIADIEDNVGPWTWFHTSNGGGGITVNISPVDSTDLVSGLRLAADEASYGTGMSAHVVREKRALVIGADGKLDFMSAAIERDILPLGQANMPQATNLTDMQSQLRGQQQWLDGLLTRYDANRSTSELSVGPRRVESISEAGNGYAYLARVTSNRSARPPIYGPYLVEFDKRGEQSRVRLQSLEEQLDIRLTMLAPASNNGFYLFGANQKTGDSHLVLIDRNGQPLAHGRTTNDGGAIVEGMMADDSGAWLYGHEYRNKDRSRVWIQRLDFK
jgi:hypothetical protein